MTEELTPRYKIVVVGDGAAGKERVLFFFCQIFTSGFPSSKIGKKQTMLIFD